MQSQRMLEYALRTYNFFPKGDGLMMKKLNKYLLCYFFILHLHDQI